MQQQSLRGIIQDSLGHKIYNIFNDNYYGSERVFQKEWYLQKIIKV